jgi:hypothetical protein
MDPVLDLLSAAVTGLQERWNDTTEVMYLLQELLKEAKDEA